MIAFTSDRDNNVDVYVMNADGTGLTRLTEHMAVDAYPAWSPEGGKIAFTSQRDDNAEIYVVNADGTLPTRITDDPSFDGFPVWSTGSDP